MSVTPQPSDGAIPVALYLTGIDTAVACMGAYVQADGTLGATPVYQLPAQWETISVTGEAILPATNYGIEARFESAVTSPPMAVTTWSWGDVDNNGVCNFSDVLHTVHGFRGDFTNATLEMVDIWGCTPDGLVNFEDIQQCVRSFQGATYEDMACPPVCP
jgi:hypothetical protein